MHQKVFYYISCHFMVLGLLGCKILESLKSLKRALLYKSNILWFLQSFGIL